MPRLDTSRAVTPKVLSSALMLIALLVTSRADAQAFVQSDLVGSPLGLVETPVLTAGFCYEIQTVNLSETADPIITIRTGGSDLDSTIAGADACGSDLVPACARFCPTTTRSYTVWVRAYSTATRGSIDLRIQQLRNIFAPLIETGCAPGIPVALGCWSNMSIDLAFGGMIRVPGIIVSSWFQVETTELPGIQGGAGLTSSHIIVFAGFNDDPTQNWNILPSGHPALLGSGAPGSHRKKVLWTAQYSGLQPAATPPSWNNITPIAAPYGGSGPFRLIRNDYVYDTVARAGTDGDGDQLGPALENLLKSCDSTATPNQSGLSCANLPSCPTAPTSDACKQSMRDSDQDGLRDDVELYGVQLYDSSGAKLDGGYVARYGANPAHYDLFVEVDYNGLLPVAGTCTADPRTGRAATQAFTRTDAARMASQYATATAALFPNRDGIGGIAAHFDIGSLTLTDKPIPTDTTGGDWGGSNCYKDFPTCSSDVDCAGGGSGSCCAVSTGCTSTQSGFVLFGECIKYDPRLEWMSRARRWLFFSLSDFQIGLGGQTPLPMQGYGSGTAAIVHESGHQGGLTHEGPWGTGMGVIGNVAVNRQTIMNYAYSYVAGAMLTGTGARSPTRVTFSGGQLPSLKPLALPEAQPLGTSDVYDLVRDFTVFRGTRVRTTVGSEAIDFNEDGSFATTGITVEGRVGYGVARFARQVEDGVAFLSEGGPEVVEVGPAMYRVRVAGVAAGGLITRTLQQSNSSTFACSEAPVLGTGERFPACPFVSSTFTTMATGTDVPVAVAAPDDSIRISDTFGTLDATVVVYRTHAGGHSNGMLSSSGWITRGAITTPPLGLALLSTGTGFPSVARIGGTDTFLLTYRDAAGVIFEQVGTVGRFSTSWTTPAPIIPAAGLVGSPATTTLEGSTLGADGVLMVTARQVGSSLLFDLRLRAAGTWSLVTTLTQSGGTWGRPSIEVRPFRVGASTTDRLLLSWRNTGDLLNTWTRMSPSASLVGSWTAAERFADIVAATAHAAEMHFDTRYNPGGLRGVWSAVVGCPAPPAACPSGSVCAAIGGSSTTITSCMVIDDDLVQASERRLPGADAVVPLRMPDFNEWPMLRHRYCAALREEGSSTAGIPPGAGWAPDAYDDDTSTSCAPFPTYARE
jgi:hypothetical protein